MQQTKANRASTLSCRIGTEHEKLVIARDSRKRASYEQISHILQALVDRHGWNAMSEGGKIIGAERDGQSVTLEPGGQFELSGAPVSTLQETDVETASHLREVHIRAGCLPRSFLRVGMGIRD